MLFKNFWHGFSYIASAGLALNYCASPFAPMAAYSETYTPPLSLVQQPTCHDPQTQVEINICAGQSRRTADRELNRVYRLVFPNLSGARRSLLINAQRAWGQFRDAECEFSGSFAESGSMQPALEAGCLEQITLERTTDLNFYLRGETPTATGNNYRAVDSRLNQVYQQLRRRLPGVRKTKLQNAELAWIKFRDAACEFEGSSGGNAAKNSCLIRTTEQRTRQLESHLETSDL